MMCSIGLCIIHCDISLFGLLQDIESSYEDCHETLPDMDDEQLIDKTFAAGVNGSLDIDSIFVSLTMQGC